MTAQLGEVLKTVNQQRTTQPAPAATSQVTLLKFDSEQRKPPAALSDLDTTKCDRTLLDAFSDAFSSRRVPIYVYGAAGRGKSYGMAAVFVAWAGRSVEWYDVSQLLRRVIRCRMSSEGFIYETRGDGSGSIQVWESQIMERVAAAGLACFDDVGLRSPSDSMYDAWYEIVNHRKRKPTIYTGNLSPEELHKVYDARIASRLTEGTVIELVGKDRRLSQTKFVKIGA